MTSLKPHQLARKRLAKRTADQISIINKITPKSMLKSPSQKRSERERKKYLKRAGIEREVHTEVIPSDCRGCTDACRFGNDLNICQKKSLIVRCGKCGQKVRVRVVDGEDWSRCPVCASL